MLQIRLNKGASVGEGSGGTAKPAFPADSVTVACPDHLVIADLPVAKCLGAPPSSAATSIAVKSVGRRSRRFAGEKVHFCVCCDFPIAVYGRLVPCEHAFCLTCARSDSICYICEERIQKIQTIKLMEGIFICAAPHCLKSFLKRSDFVSHVQEAHADLLQPMERGANEADNNMRPSSMETNAKQSTQPEASTARAPPKRGFSPGPNTQLQDRDERSRRNQSREQTPMRPPLQPMPPPFQGRQPSAELPDGNPPQGMWFQPPPGSENQNFQPFRRDSDQFTPEKPAGVIPDSSYPEYPSQPLPLPNYPIPVMLNPGLNPPQFLFPPFPTDGSQQFYNTGTVEMPRNEMMVDGVQEQGSVLGFPPAAGIANFPENFSQQWNNAAFPNMQFPPMQGMVLTNPEGFPNSSDGHGRPPGFQGEFPDRMQRLHHPMLGKDADLQGGSVVNPMEGKNMFATFHVPLQLPLSLPPPPPLPPMPHQQMRGTFSGPD